MEDNGWRCLFDSGRHESIVDLLKVKGINKLDLAICSHNDADHSDGFIALFKASFQIDEIWLPGSWASVLQYVANNFRDCGNVEWYYRDYIDHKDYRDFRNYNGEIDSLFSDNPASEESFNQDLAFLLEEKNTEQFRQSSEHLHSYLARLITEDPDIIGFNLERIFDRIHSEDYSEGQKRVILEDYVRDWSPTAAREVHRMNRDDYAGFGSWARYCIYLALEKPEETQQKIKKAFNIKLQKILDIAGLAKEKGCHIRWFEPSMSCTKEAVDYGFVSLNSKKMCSIKMPKNGLAYMYLLSLTKENKYSLVFEYTKEGIPIIRFSADSDCSCQSDSPYQKSIIVTAPHHGSDANAKVYNAIQGNDIIWVRSDKLKSDRPCPEFKSRNKKYCLACQKYNFVTEICFEYDSWQTQWKHVRGEQCRCK